MDSGTTSRFTLDGTHSCLRSGPSAGIVARLNLGETEVEAAQRNASSDSWRLIVITDIFDGDRRRWANTQW